LRISDLSRLSGVPVPTIKFYLRERLLKPGQPTARNQAVYQDDHLRRIRLIRALTSIGGLDLSSLRELLSMVDDGKHGRDDVLRAVNRALTPQSDRAAEGGHPSHAEEVGEFVASLPWRPAPDSPAVDSLVQVVTALRELGCEADLTVFEPLVRLSGQVAKIENELVVSDDPGAAVACTVLFDVLFNVLHRVAHEHYATVRSDQVPQV
jgi:DNA-binding transcriptional MerR regulator